MEGQDWPQEPNTVQSVRNQVGSNLGRAQGGTAGQYAMDSQQEAADRKHRPKSQGCQWKEKLPSKQAKGVYSGCVQRVKFKSSCEFCSDEIQET